VTGGGGPSHRSLSTKYKERSCSSQTGRKEVGLDAKRLACERERDPSPPNSSKRPTHTNACMRAGAVTLSTAACKIPGYIFSLLDRHLTPAHPLYTIYIPPSHLLSAVAHAVTGMPHMSKRSGSIQDRKQLCTSQLPTQRKVVWRRRS
jgi:hypothetical protein